MVETSFLPGLMLSLSPRVHVHPDHVCTYIYVQRIWYARSVHVAGYQLGLRHNWDLDPIFNVVVDGSPPNMEPFGLSVGIWGQVLPTFGGAPPKFPTLEKGLHSLSS